MANHQKIQVLNSIEIIQKRSEIFIGENNNPNHLVNEVLDNAFDELSEGNANRIDVFFNNKENSIWIADNGKGLPVGELTKLENGEEKDSIEVIFTILFSGAKFELDNNQTLFGQHGIGLVSVNALSNWVHVFVRDKINKNNIFVYEFEEGFLKKRYLKQDKQKYSTLIGFKPNKKYFKSEVFDFEPIINRLLLVKAHYNNCRIAFNNNVLNDMSFGKYVRTVLSIDKKHKLYLLEHKIRNQYIKIYLAVIPKETNLIQESDVNLRSCKGLFLKHFSSKIAEKLKLLLKNKLQLPEKLADHEFLSGFRIYISLRISNPKFNGPAKEKMILDISKEFINPLDSKIDNFLKNEDIIDIIQKNLERKFRKKVVKQNSFKKVSASNKLRDCIEIPGETLFIVEGDSADGTLKVIRNKKNEASFPLKGKIINAETKSYDKIIDNVETKNLLESLGSVNNRRYKKVKILTDADADGLHISVLVILFFQKYATDIIKNGNLSVIIPPLYGGTKNKKFVPIYKFEEVKKYKNKGFTITRFKGLGEMNPDQLDVAIRNNYEYIVEYPNNEESLRNLLLVVTNNDIKKKLLFNKDCVFKNIIDNIEPI